MIRWISRSLSRKLSCLLLLSILVPLLSLGYFSYTTASNVTEENAKQSGLSILRQLDTNLDFIIKDIENMSLFLIGNKDMQQYLSTKGDHPVQQTQMNEFISNLVYSKPYISDITIYPEFKSNSISNTTILESGAGLSQKAPA